MFSIEFYLISTFTNLRTGTVEITVIETLGIIDVACETGDGE